MNPRFIVGLAGLCLAVTGAKAFDARQRSDSASKQFSIYCEDVRLRHRVVSFVEDVKADVLRVLGETDRWRIPIVVTIVPGPDAQNTPPVVVRLLETDSGSKIEVNVRIGDDPAAVNLQRQVVRALLLEYEYRGVPIRAGSAIVEPPWWVIDGIVQIARRRDLGPPTDLYKTLVETNKLPPIEDFLTENPEGLGATAAALDQALALCLLQTLVEQQDGHENLARLIREWPRSGGDSVAMLKKDFPRLATDCGNLQKWWTLNLARFAAADRYIGLTADETEKELVPLLQIEPPPGKDGEKKTFKVSEFEHFVKTRGIRAILNERHAAIIALGSHANALYRPVIADYEAVFAFLAAGKTKGVRERIAHGETTRDMVIRRTTEIADYLKSGYEATQMGSQSETFDSYLKTANELSEQDRKRTNPIARYLDELEREF